MPYCIKSQPVPPAMQSRDQNINATLIALNVSITLL
jgi:hypothetical protein